MNCYQKHNPMVWFYMHRCTARVINPNCINILPGMVLYAQVYCEKIITLNIQRFISMVLYAQVYCESKATSQ